MKKLINLIKSHEKAVKNILTLTALFFLILLGVKNVYARNIGLTFDVMISILILVVFHMLYNRLHQDHYSHFFIIFSLILHNLYLYPTSPLGIRFDHYMHFLAGFTIALIIDRVFYENISKVKRFFLLMIAALGIGAFGEIFEWLGYGMLGYGDGFFLFGSGDEGEWRNCILDLIFDLFGGLLMILIMLFRHKETDKR